MDGTSMRLPVVAPVPRNTVVIVRNYPYRTGCHNPSTARSKRAGWEPSAETVADKKYATDDEEGKVVLFSSTNITHIENK
jgi:hypothetical protein